MTRKTRGAKSPVRLLLSPCRRRQPSVLKCAVVLAWLKRPSLNITIVTSQHLASGLLGFFRGIFIGDFGKAALASLEI